MLPKNHSLYQPRARRWTPTAALTLFLAFAGAAGCASSADRVPPTPPIVAPDAAFLAKSMEERWTAAVDARLAAGLGWGYLAAFRDAGKTRHLTRGKRSLEPVREVGAKDSFEIGSVSKLFTGILLHLAAEERKLALTDPLVKFFPELTDAAAGAITLQELGQHRSGLASAPPTLTEHIFENPWRDWTKEQVLGPLREAALAAPPTAGGVRAPAYSNWGYMILGLVLEKTYRQGYERILRQKMLVPLGMRETGVDRTSPARRRKGRAKRASNSGSSRATKLMPSFTLASDPSMTWEFSGFVAATGGIESTVTDMGKLLEAIDLATALESRARSRIPGRLLTAIRASRETGVGWDSPSGEPYAWKNGATAAFSAILAWDEERRRGIFIAGNSRVSVDALAGIALGRDARDSLAAPALAAPAPTEESLAAVRGLYRVTDPEPKPAANWNHSLRTVEIFESFGHPRVRLDAGAVEKEGTLLLATTDEEVWFLLDSTGQSHLFEVTGRGAELVMRERDGTKAVFELQKVERPMEKYPALE